MRHEVGAHQKVRDFVNANAANERALSRHKAKTTAGAPMVANGSEVGANETRTKDTAIAPVSVDDVAANAPINALIKKVTKA